MADEPKHTTEELIARGDRMQQLMDDPLMVEAFDRVEADVVTAWKNADTPPKREALHAKHTALQSLKAEMRAIVGQREYAKQAVEVARRRAGR